MTTMSLTVTITMIISPAMTTRTDMEFVKNFTPPDFQAKNFTPSISPNFNSFSDKNTKKLVKMEKFTPLTKILHCRRHWRHGQIPPLSQSFWYKYRTKRACKETEIDKRAKSLRCLLWEEVRKKRGTTGRSRPSCLALIRAPLKHTPQFVTADSPMYVCSLKNMFYFLIWLVTFFIDILNHDQPRWFLNKTFPSTKKNLKRWNPSLENNALSRMSTNTQLTQLTQNVL